MADANTLFDFFGFLPGKKVITSRIPRNTKTRSAEGGFVLFLSSSYGVTFSGGYGPALSSSSTITTSSTEKKL
jgi:hypothetical protein